MARGGVGNDDQGNCMTELQKRGPGRPRKNPEEIMTPKEVIDALDVKPITPNKALDELAVAITAPEPKPETPKLYTFKVLRGTHFAEPDFMVIDVDAEGKWQAPRQPNSREFGIHSKVLKGTIVMVNKDRAKSFDAHNIGKRVDNYE
jgi:hypothetical protein